MVSLAGGRAFHTHFTAVYIWYSIAEQGCGTFNQQSELSTNSLCAPPTSLPSALQDTFRLNTQFMRPPNVKQGQLRGKRANARRLACLRKERMCAAQPLASFNAAQTARQVKAAVARRSVCARARAPEKECTTHSFELKTNQRTVADWMADWVVPPFHVLRSRSGNGGRGPRFPL